MRLVAGMKSSAGTTDAGSRGRELFERYGLIALAMLAVVAIIVGKADLKAVSWLTTRTGDLLTPALAVLREPVLATRQLADRFGGLMAAVDENARLRAENRRLLVWQAEAARLAVENESLRELLRMTPVEAAPLAAAARILADGGGAFVRTLLLDVGAEQGLAPGMAVVDESGMLGRLVAVGERSSRVLLLTDLNSKIPVITERSRDQAILEGTNDGLPELRFLPANPAIVPGERVLTSGRDGMLPPGLLIGEVTEIHDQRVVVRPYVDWDRAHHVAVLRYRPPPLPEELPAALATAPTGAAVGQAELPGDGR